MKLPCWIKHNWDLFEEPKSYTCDRYNTNSVPFGGKPEYLDTVKTTIQIRRCKKCGLVQEKTIKVEVYTKVLSEK